MKTKRNYKGSYEISIDELRIYIYHGSDGWYFQPESFRITDNLQNLLDSLKSSYKTKKELIDSLTWVESELYANIG